MSAAHRARSALTSTSNYLALAAFVGAPLFYGSVDGLWISIWCLVIGISLAIAPRRAVTSAELGMLLPIALTGVFILFVVFVQMKIRPGPGLEDSAWQDVRNAFGISLDSSFSTTRSGPWFALGPTLVFVLAFLRSFLLCRSTIEARRLLIVLAAAGTVYAIAGMGLFVLSPQADFGRANFSYANSLTGPFVNRNTAAVFWGSAALILQVLLLRSATRQLRGVSSVAGFLYRLQDNPATSLFVIAGALLLCLCATAMSGSRSVVLLTAGLLLLSTVLWLGQRFSNWRILLGGTLAATGVVAVLLQVGGEGIARRIDRAGLFDGARWEAYRSTIRMIADHPWLGIGLGNFETAFPGYRSEALGSFGIWDHAHDTPLELTAELGLPVAIAVAAVWVAIAATLVGGFRHRRSARHFPLVALCVGLLGTLHSLVDFSLQIPGYSIFFAAIVACGLAQSVRPPAVAGSGGAPAARPGDGSPRQRRRRGAFSALALRLTTWCVPADKRKTSMPVPSSEGSALAPLGAATLHVIVATPLGLGGKGGIDRIMDEVRRQLATARPAGLAVSFLTTRGQKHIALSPLFLVLAIVRLASARFAGKADVLHVNLSSHGSTTRKTILCRAAALLGIPYVVHLHGSRFRQFHEAAAPAQAARIDAMFTHAAEIIVLGQVWRRFILGRLPGAATTVLPNASRAPGALARRTASPLTILFLGQVGPRKGVPDLVAALATLRDQPGWRAVIAGNGDVEATRAKIASLGLADRISLTGWVGTRDVERLLAAADILVLPSYDENLPMSVIEAMAHGLAVVTTPVGAVEDIITDGESGLLVPPGDPGRLADAIGRLILDPGLRRRLGDTAAAYHRDHLEIGPYLTRLVSIWRAVATAR